MKNVNTRVEFLDEVSLLLPYKPVCLEIGTYQGEFTELMYKRLRPSKLYTIDPFEIMTEPITKRDYYTGAHSSHRILYSDNNTLQMAEKLLSEQIKNNEIIIDINLSTDAVTNYPKNYFDFIYIDACHMYECVKSDLELYLPKLKKGGYMAGHDYGDFGVTQAVDEFCKKYNYEIQMLCRHQGDWMLTSKF